tara:strand:- start:491 stop:817 length:327 start_codon:yes stop_codon:yes gene_type:complete
MVYIIDDVWLYIKLFLFHNIKIHGKHLEDNKDIKKYNSIIKKFNMLLCESDTFKIVYDSALKQTRMVKLIYNLKYKKINKLIIEFSVFREKDYKKEYYALLNKKNINK